MTDKEVREEINALYKRVYRVNKSTKFYKCDLHVHSPASKDYIWNNSKDDEESEYRLFLNNFINSDTDIIAITDHNTVKGYYRLKCIIEKDEELKKSLGKKLILPGVEITCYGKHFLAIFKENYNENKLNSLLNEAGIDIAEEGTEAASADRLSPLTLCEKINEYEGIVIIAHADSDNGLLQDYFKKRDGEISIRGKSIEKILKSQAVYGICYNYDKNLDRVIDLKNNFKVNNIALLKASDSHSSIQENYKASGMPLGSRCSWISMGKLSFNALKIALRDETSRVTNSLPKKNSIPHIIGLCVKGGFLSNRNRNDWAVIPFSNGLNCIIGARGTGKSTMIDILKFLLNPYNKDIANSIIGRFSIAITFVYINDEIFAIRMNNPVSLNKLNITYYQLKKESFKKISKNFKIDNLSGDNILISDYLNLSEVQGFRQKDILEISKLELGPTMMIRSLANIKELEKSEQTIKGTIREQCKEIRNERRIDKNADLSSSILDKEYGRYIEKQVEINNRLQEVITNINEIMKDELKIVYKFSISKKVYKNMIERWLNNYRFDTNIGYDKRIEYEKILNKLFEENSENYWIMYRLFTMQTEDLISKLSLKKDTAKEICEICHKNIEDLDLLITPQMMIDYELNVNHGTSNKKVFIHRNKLSYGQKAVGMLLIILVGATKLGERRPLVIDQPEDDLDNSYIYHTLVKQFSSIKHLRQLIIATHNPNIPIAGDSENILIMNSNGINGWLELSGNIDNEKVAEKVLQILEGDIEAFEKRAEKFGYKLVKMR